MGLGRRARRSGLTICHCLTVGCPPVPGHLVSPHLDTGLAAAPGGAVIGGARTIHLPKLPDDEAHGSASRPNTQPGVAALRVHTGPVLFITVLMWTGNRNFKGLMKLRLSC